VQRLAGGIKTAGLGT